MRVEGHLRPSQARSSISFPFDVAPGAGTLTVRLRYAPDRVTRVKNLVTLSLFDPGGFRGAGHRHATEQTVLVSRREATPGFVPGPITAGTWTIELDLHAVLPSLRRGVEYALEVETAPTVADDPGIDEEVPDEKPVEPGRPDEPSPQPSPKGRGSREPSLGGRGSLDQEPPAGWLKGDVHVHSNHSDARWSMDDLVEHIRQHRLDFVALTDHNTVTGRDALRRALRRAGLDPVVIDGMELTT